MTMNANTTLTLIGGPTVLIELAGLRLLTDPTFDPPGRYDLGSVTLVKQAGPAIAADRIGALDAILLTHDQHADNLDQAGRALLAKAKRVFSTPIASRRLGGGVESLVSWQTVELPRPGGGKLFVTGTPARHGPAGIEAITGDVTGFLLGLDKPGDAVYISGDTVWYEGVAEVARRYRPKLIVLFTGAAQTRGKFHLTMNNNDAIDAAVAFKDSKVVAVHNHGWEHFKESQDDLAQAFTALGLASRLELLEAGVAKTITP
jgi:L-ascorbate metabolism protein UlaG (beta-lactamase superfamily)